MKLYNLLSEQEKKACKELNVRNSFLKDITIEELSAMHDVIVTRDSHDHGAILVLEELFHRQKIKS